MSPQKTRELLIFGDSAFAEIACEYFTQDTEYRVAGFAVDAAFLTRDRLLDRPVVAVEEAVRRFPPGSHDVYAAAVYTELNRLRARFCRRAKELGYRLASYVSPRAFLWPNVTLGEHCFVFEDNVVQPFVRVGANVVLWSGNHVGHHSTIGDNVFVSSHVVLSGFCDVGENCFLGVNAAVANNIRIARDCWLGPGVVISKDTREGEIYRAPEPVAAKVDARRFFKVRD